MKTKQMTTVLLISILLLGGAFAPLTDVAAEEQTAPPGGGMGGADTMTYDYSGELKGILVADNQETSSDGESHSSEGSDENTVLVKNGGVLTLSKANLKKSGESANDDNSNFYGLNSILLAVNQDSLAYLSDSEITASGKGSNGLFATDSGTIYANENTITTEEPIILGAWMRLMGARSSPIKLPFQQTVSTAPL